MSKMQRIENLIKRYEDSSRMIKSRCHHRGTNETDALLRLMGETIKDIRYIVQSEDEAPTLDIVKPTASEVKQAIEDETNPLEKRTEMLEHQVKALEERVVNLVKEVRQHSHPSSCAF